mgnify:CR=1 FL=1
MNTNELRKLITYVEALKPGGSARKLNDEWLIAAIDSYQILDKAFGAQNGKKD